MPDQAMRARHGEGGAQHAEVARKRIAVALAAHPTVHERDETVEIVIGHLDNAVGAVGRPEQVFVIIVVRDREHASRQQECDRGVNREAMHRAMRHEPPFRTTRSLHGAW